MKETKPLPNATHLEQNYPIRMKIQHNGGPDNITFVAILSLVEEGKILHFNLCTLLFSPSSVKKYGAARFAALQ